MFSPCLESRVLTVESGQLVIWLVLQWCWETNHNQWNYRSVGHLIAVSLSISMAWPLQEDANELPQANGLSIPETPSLYEELTSESILKQWLWLMVLSRKWLWSSRTFVKNVCLDQKLDWFLFIFQKWDEAKDIMIICAFVVDLESLQCMSPSLVLIRWLLQIDSALEVEKQKASLFLWARAGFGGRRCMFSSFFTKGKCAC